MKKLTVFTPTYNRLYILSQLYASLCRQTNEDFVWLIIDDGSSDGTQEVVKQWQNENIVKIQYAYKENGGMHTAHNLAYDLIETELNVCIDSDDYMTDDAVEKIVAFWEMNKDDKVGGIYALDVDKNGIITGEKFPEDLHSFKGWGCKIILYGENNEKSVKITGDKKFIAVTKVLKRYPKIPVFEGEKYYSLYYKQHFIERDYTILILNEPVCVVEYLNDGSSLNMYSQYIRNPKGFKHLRLLMLEMCPIFSIRFMQAIHYVNACFILKQYNFLKVKKHKLLIFSTIPFGFLLYVLTRYKHAQLQKRNA